MLPFKQFNAEGAVVKKQIVFVMSIAALAIAVPSASFAKTKQSHHAHHKAGHHRKHYLFHNDHHHVHDRHDTRSPKWHPTIQEHRHVHD